MCPTGTTDPRAGKSTKRQPIPAPGRWRATPSSHWRHTSLTGRWRGTRRRGRAGGAITETIPASTGTSIRCLWRPLSSGDQSICLRNRGSGVRIPQRALFFSRHFGEASVARLATCDPKEPRSGLHSLGGPSAHAASPAIWRLSSAWKSPSQQGCITTMRCNLIEPKQTRRRGNFGSGGCEFESCSGYHVYSIPSTRRSSRSAWWWMSAASTRTPSS